eukprot:CAMPEP_0196572120 /NCGR_PEP_ID=MMETSP1081-20130531/2217_1 /TAXON_ID=36882 /ORGANISM="Pyramimonas amylifera, Strain CCMP720" /LENGTH=268 /DNA_ID=CAMNT_0041889325 /DNA_START=104 /DNA_END=910 /DNA_ORIENTATION=-
MAASMLSSRVLTGVSRTTFANKSGSAVRGAVSNGSKVTMRAMWLPGSEAPAHLDGSMAGDFGFDPLNLGADSEALSWYREAELQHARWAMVAVTGVLVQEVFNPDVFFYDAAIEATLPFPILGVVAAQFLMMHYVEIRRWRDWQKPGSVDVDPLFSGNSLPAHEVGYPGGIFDPLGYAKGNVEELKVKEIKNGRLAMLAFAGFIVQAQATGKGPVECFLDHVAHPLSNTIVARGIVTPSTVISPGCAIEPFHIFQGVGIPTPCLPLWP